MPDVPTWVDYDEDQRRFHISPEVVEAQFCMRSGNLIQPNYLHELHEMLDDIITTINYNLFHSSEEEALLCDVVNVSYQVQVDSVCLQSVIVRPCAEGLGLFKIILYFFMHACGRRGVRLMVNPESAKVRSLLLSITHCFQIRQVKIDSRLQTLWVLQPIFLRAISARQCRILGKFDYNEREFAYYINRDFFPSHTALNDTASLEARKPLKAVVKEIQDTKAKHRSPLKVIYTLICCCFH